MRKLLFLTGMVMMIALQFNCEGSFTREVDLDYTDYKTKGVLFSILTNTDDRDSAFHNFGYPVGQAQNVLSNRIYISNSVPYKYKHNKFYRAEVMLESGELELALKFHDQHQLHDDDSPFYSVQSGIVPGRKYQLFAEFNGDTGDQFIQRWPSISATDSVPEPVSFVLEDGFLGYPEKAGDSIEGYIDLLIEDEPQRNNLYQIEVSAIPWQDSGSVHQETTVVYGVVEHPEDRVNSEIFGSSQGDYFEEIDFTREGRKRIYFQLSNQGNMFSNGKPVQLMVRLANLSENYIRFLKSSQQFYANQDNPFTEPVEVYSNIENGYGIFALAARSYGSIVCGL